MGCMVEISEHKRVVRFEFIKHRQQQRHLLKALLCCGRQNLEGIAMLIGASTATLHKVQRGLTFLEEKQADELGKLFLLRFSDS